MSTNTNPTEDAKPSTSPKLTSAVKAYLSAESKLEIARDNMNQVAKSEAVRLGLSDVKALNMLLFGCGLTDARTVSEIGKFVFPANAENREVLDSILEKNATLDDPKKRISKKVLLTVARSKEPITLKEAVALVAKDNPRTPGGKTSQTEPAKAKKETAVQKEERIKNAICAALNELKKEEYTEEDTNTILEECVSTVFSDEDTEGDDDTETDENE